MKRKTLTVSFPGGLKTDVQIGDWTIKTDQSPRNGGEGSAPEPFQLFLASLAACAGVYALDFCLNRKISTDGLSVIMHADFDPEQRRYTRMIIEVNLPRGFPEKYRDAILRAADLCAVKKHMLNPPEFELVAVPADVSM